jgi:hypothetical protein
MRRPPGKQACCDHTTAAEAMLIKIERQDKALEAVGTSEWSQRVTTPQPPNNVIFLSLS